MTILPPSSFDEELNDRIMQEDHAAGGATDRIPDLPGNRVVAELHELMVALYRILVTVNYGLPPIPDQLPRMGRAGAWIHRVTCRRHGSWEAFRHSAARRFHDIPYPTPLVEGRHILVSSIERLVLRALLSLSGVYEPDVHPPLCGSSLSADFLVRATNGRFVYIEVAGLLESADSTDRDDHCADYRMRLLGKLATYRALQLEPPVLIFIGDLAPHALAQKLNEVRGRLGLPLQSSCSLGWSDIICVEE